jgi:hypothetical protein
MATTRHVEKHCDENTSQSERLYWEIVDRYIELPDDEAEHFLQVLRHFAEENLDFEAAAKDGVNVLLAKAPVFYVPDVSRWRDRGAA